MFDNIFQYNKVESLNIVFYRIYIVNISNNKSYFIASLNLAKKLLSRFYSFYLQFYTGA